ncbi:hypothetical protein BX600DRAFT_475267 [Xylariales sp. PMI_506]|nr:hypothetical protein BX600DRAFT_475267 [Xylariales sp. PMI_506]
MGPVSKNQVALVQVAANILLWASATVCRLGQSSMSLTIFVRHPRPQILYELARCVLGVREPPPPGASDNRFGLRNARHLIPVRAQLCSEGFPHSADHEKK